MEPAGLRMEYNIKPIGRTCSGTGQTLAPGAACYSALVLENGKLVRLDFDAATWQGPPENAVAHWQSEVPADRETPGNPLDPDALFEYFERISEDEGDFQQKMRYVLALLLVRKRRLQIEGSRDDGDESFLQLSGARGEGRYEVRDPELSETEIEELQSQLLPA